MKLFRSENSERGVGLVQLALILPLLLTFAVGLMDLGRFLAVQAILSKAAENAANLAAKMPNLDIDYRNLDPDDPDYLAYVESRDAVLRRAVELPLSTLLSDFDEGSSMQLISFRMVDQELNVGAGNNDPELVFGAAMIRPGERAERIANSNDWVGHSLFPPKADGSAPPQAQDMLQKRFPIEVIVEADVFMILPIFNRIRAQGVAKAYHEITPEGPIPASARAPGSPPITTTSSSTTTTTTVTTTSTTTTLACTVNWPMCVGQSMGSSAGAFCPDPTTVGGTCLCATAACEGVYGQ